MKLRPGAVVGQQCQPGPEPAIRQARFRPGRSAGPSERSVEVGRLENGESADGFLPRGERSGPQSTIGADPPNLDGSTFGLGIPRRAAGMGPDRPAPRPALTPKCAAMTHQPPVVYEIDAADRIVRVSPDWSAVALAAGAPELDDAFVVGRSLWDFVADPTTRQLYAAMLERARTEARPLSFSFRCDTPTERRLMQMQLTGLPAGGVAFEVRVIAVQARPAVVLLDCGTPRRGMVRMCSWCKRLPVPSGEWLEVEDAVKVLDLLDRTPLPAITHGICPQCYERVLAALAEDEPGGPGGVVLGRLPPA